MQRLTQQPAEQYSSFRLPYFLKQVYLADKIADLEQFTGPEFPIVLGEGTNTIFLDNQHKPVLRYLADGKTLQQLGGDFLLHVEAGHNWHQLVSWTVTQKLWGLENLALIPGSVGAAPVQNIGAYGVEFADRCIYVDFYHWRHRTVTRMPLAECGFGYRDSVFKQQLQGLGVIVAVGLKLSAKATPVLRYPGLDSLPTDANIEQIFNRVIEVRQSKLPDYKELPNCGSFFKNPVLDQGHFEVVAKAHPAMPSYVQSDGIKVPAAWLIEQAGFKGVITDQVGCYQKQPLVIVNFGLTASEPLLTLIKDIRDTIKQHFGIELEPEVRLLDHTGSHYVPG